MILIDTDSYQILGQKYGLPSEKCGMSAVCGVRIAMSTTLSTLHVLQLNATVHNRMRSGSAAAIAVQQTRNSALFHDTDTLIRNDSIVVYDQRTAL